MASYRHAPTFSPRLWVAITTTVLACIVSVAASLNLYLLEDGNSLTQAAYSASPVLRFSYDGVYLSALIACIGVCAIIAYIIVRADTLVTIGLIILSLLIAFAGFGGLLVRYPLNFLFLFLVFVGLVLVSVLSGWSVAARLSRHLEQQFAAIIGACVSAGIALLVNVVALVVHTIMLNPVSHTLFMQGLIGETHFNSLLIAMGLELLTIVIYVLGLGFALRSPSQP